LEGGECRKKGVGVRRRWLVSDAISACGGVALVTSAAKPSSVVW
jgi:hypothetical protein